jgi:phosphoglycerate kinase
VTEVRPTTSAPGRERFAGALRRIAFTEVDVGAISRARERLLPLSSLADLDAGSVVLVRADLDMAVADGEVRDLARIHAGLPTLRYCLDRGWRVVVFGHLGRHGASLAPVQRALGQELGRAVTLVDDWLDESRLRVTDQAVGTVEAAENSSIIMLENTRRYAIEQALWSVGSGDFPDVANRMYEVAADMRERLGSVFVNEAIAASNLDFSSCALPLVMQRAALGEFVSDELAALEAAADADIVVMSGLKANKLDDLEHIVERGNVRLVIVAGALAMSLRKAEGGLRGEDVSIGLAERADDAPFYVAPDRVEQARRILLRARETSARVVLPVDFVLSDGTTARTIPPDQAQEDIGPASTDLFRDALTEMTERRSAEGPVRLYFNGVPGRFEDPRFSSGTEALVGLIRDLRTAGVKAYVGGGEGRRALLQYGTLSDVEHAFTAGGTVLKAVTGRPLPFLTALEEQRALAERNDQDADG